MDFQGEISVQLRIKIISWVKYIRRFSTNNKIKGTYLKQVRVRLDRQAYIIQKTFQYP